MKAERALGDSEDIPSHHSVTSTCQRSHDDDNHRSFSAHKSSTTYDTEKNLIIDNELRQPIRNLHEHLNGVWLNWSLPVFFSHNSKVVLPFWSKILTESHTSDAVIIIIPEMFSVNTFKFA